MNTLSLCTMHSERQFIHTPVFNAYYFDIPPKLLAYYNAIVYNIAYQQKSADLRHPSYHYIIIPDYRTDIYVEPLNIPYKEDTDDHVAIICLSEKYFHQPSKAIMLLAHEAGHYEGERKCVIDYLTHCETPHSNSMDFILKAVYQPSTNRKEWCQSLCSTLSDYETKIQSMYDINNENILTDPVL